MVVAVQETALQVDDVDAFWAFYEQALPRVYGYFVRRCGGDATVAEDLTQEAFLAAVTELKRHRVVTLPLPWLFGIARHKLLDHYRRRRGEPAEILSWDENLDNADLPALTWAEDEARDLAVTALRGVPTAQREALVLHHLDGLSVGEVAELLGRSAPAVESLLARGRASFKRCYVEALRG